MSDDQRCHEEICRDNVIRHCRERIDELEKHPPIRQMGMESELTVLHRVLRIALGEDVEPRARQMSVGMFGPGDDDPPPRDP